MNHTVTKLPKTEYAQIFTGTNVLLNTAKASRWQLDLPNHWLSNAHVFLHIQGRMEKVLPEVCHQGENKNRRNQPQKTYFQMLQIRNTLNHEVILVEPQVLLPIWLRQHHYLLQRNHHPSLFMFNFNEEESNILRLNQQLLPPCLELELMRSVLIPLPRQADLQIGDHLMIFASLEPEHPNYPIETYLLQPTLSVIFLAPNLVFTLISIDGSEHFVVRDLFSVYKERMGESHANQGNIQVFRRS